MGGDRRGFGRMTKVIDPDRALVERAILEACRASVLVKRDPHEAMAVLAEAFPSLRGAPDLRPWSPAALHAWACERATLMAGGRDAARFLLDVWQDGSVEGLDCPSAPLGPFDAVRSMFHWDEAHRAAFATWVAHPWWP
jgi:hypothetical protein